MMMLFPFTGKTALRIAAGKAGDGPKIVNIVNFIRLLEPRDEKITQDVLYQTVVKQTEIMQQYDLGGTFLLQYDALMDTRYQQLLKSLPREKYEIGAWWELPQPLVEKAGFRWRGRYPWDWHADVGFSTGYTPEEREKLVDVYMADFKAVFGYYPRSVASWFIDAHTLNYMYDKYGIVASANCKDQYGTDGYTLWGGYWNQAYYPSRINSYMPAQHAKNQLPVPIFRMLGSDPIRQYDLHLGARRQGVITLEPVYPRAGGDSTWVHWFMREFVEGASLAFNYTQAGQENSFTWKEMEKGFLIQMPLIAQLRNEGKIRVETLEASGKWFKEKFPVTPATAFTVNNDLPGSDLKTVWFNSRFYRLNLLWENGQLRIRDVHLFDEKLPSIYTTQKATSNECVFLTLPFVDGYLWSKKDHYAGMRFKALVNGKEEIIQGGDPVITEPAAGKLHVSWPLKNIGGSFEMDITEKTMKVQLKGNRQKVNWFLDMTTAGNAALPFRNIRTDRIECESEGLPYAVKAVKGKFSAPGEGIVFRASPRSNVISLDFSNGN
ncbi:hypothetical protein CCY01nite_09210 [Chitinophaga cymbidii]|uniref:Uncharacterized protein n=2 Tax=Chitinophaga cymbidii TaxID=1096750 RepID=A0A512RG32_9BACT|nr:hypothetical protein CCY01nite_09210 [Chitinophaga cymbidii]